MKIAWILLVSLSISSITVYSQPGSMRTIAYKKHPVDLIPDLRSDNIRWNAICAYEAIFYFTGEEFQLNMNLMSDLEKVLDSDDWQQRQIAADILRYLITWKQYQPAGPLQENVPFQRLIEVCIEGLRNDAFPNIDRGGCMWVVNASRGCTFLLAYPTMGTQSLENALESDDHQQQFLAALILGGTGRVGKIERIAQILIPHLHDDSINENACMAVYGLYHAGKDIIPYLEPFRNDPDPQMRDCVQLILRDLESPPTTPSEKWERHTQHHLSEYKSDPAVDRAWDDIPRQWDRSFLTRSAHPD